MLRAACVWLRVRAARFIRASACVRARGAVGRWGGEGRHVRSLYAVDVELANPVSVSLGVSLLVELLLHVRIPLRRRWSCRSRRRVERKLQRRRARGCNKPRQPGGASSLVLVLELM